MTGEERKKEEKEREIEKKKRKMEVVEKGSLILKIS